MLVDSNIIIYASQPEHDWLREFIAENQPFVSAISYLEVLGYHRLTETDKAHFEVFFASANVLPLSRQILDGAVRLRQQRKMSMGDSLIAATCLEHRLILVTRNTQDFMGIQDLKLLDPFEK